MKNPDFSWLANSLETRLYIQHEIVAMQLSFEAFLYQTASHLNLQNDNEYFSFYLFRNGQIPAVACIHFSKDSKDFISPARAPFGGIQCDKNCTVPEILFFLYSIEDWFSASGACAIKIKTAPSCYHSGTFDVLSHTYEMAGYNAVDKFTNYHINISPEPFCKNITFSEIRRLTKCKKSGFRAEIYDKPDAKIVYDFIKESRDTNGYKISITSPQLAILLNKFPQECQVFVVRDKRKIIALTVTILVNNKILYNFLPADLHAYKNYSPTVYLTEAIYNYCQKKGISILDLGISLDHNGIQKPGLLKFKKNLGGEESLKVTYQKIKTKN